MNKNIKMVRGDTLAFAVNIEFDDNVQDLENAYFSCSHDFDRDNYIFQKSLGNGIEKISNNGNKLIYSVRVAPEDTQNVDLGYYYYDLKIGLNSDAFTILRGILKIEKNITKEE